LGFSLAQAFLPETSWLAALAADTGLYDLVYTSFALHHLSTEQKAEFFRRVAQRLEKDGLLLLTDIVREEDESLPVYLRRYCDWLRSDWGALNVEEKASACDHILNNDRPETFSVLRALAQAGGLGYAVAVARYGWHRGGLPSRHHRILQSAGRFPRSVVRDKPAFRIKNRFLARNIWGYLCR
jgi:SAM-dependent methyltransferase